jgi:hypothetical protein
MTNKLTPSELKWVYGVNEMSHMNQEENPDYIEGKENGWKKEDNKQEE